MTIWAFMVLFAAVFIVTATCIPIYKNWILRRGILDEPNERSSHTTPTPRGGGLVIAIVVLAVYVASSAFTGTAISFGFLIGGALIVGISWLDDLISVPVLIRLVVHAIATSAILIEKGWIHSFADLNSISVAFTLIAFAWIVWLVNAYNFMDGIDGIAGLQAVIAGIGWMIFGAITNDQTLTSLGGSIAAACVAFLLFNWQPAKIFMGDAGSAFLGFVFAVLPLLVDRTRPAVSNEAYWAGLFFIWLFAFDSVFTFLRRAINREALWRAHRSHIYQRLVISGYSHSQVSTLYGIFAVLLVIAYFAVQRFQASQTLSLCLAAVLSAFLVGFNAYRERIAAKTDE